MLPRSSDSHLCPVLSRRRCGAAACTTGAQHVVNELYRHMLQRQPDAASAGWVQQLENGRMAVRDVVRAIASSPN